MLESYIAFVPYESRPSLTAPGLETAVCELEPGFPAEVEAGAADDSLLLKLNRVLVMVTSKPGQMPHEAIVTSLGMADIPETEAERITTHSAHVTLVCSDESDATPMEKMIALVKTGMALCNHGGWAMCLPGSGICLLADELQRLAALNHTGPRVWGVNDETEEDLPGYQKYTLWDSLRHEAQPASLIVGFVPAEVDGRTWFFSAGHSLFGLPEIAYADGNLDDFKTVRELFRFIFSFMHRCPDSIENCKIIKTNDPALSIVLENLPPRFSDLQSPTGTLRVRLLTVGQFGDWETV